MDNLTVEEAKVSKKENKNTGYITCKDSVQWPSDTNLAAIFKEADALLIILNMCSPLNWHLFLRGIYEKTCKTIIKKLHFKKSWNIISLSVCCVIDGGFLLHKGKWTIWTTFNNVIKSYEDHAKARFDSVIICV